MNQARECVPVSQKYALTVEEAAEYSGLGVKKIRELSNDNECPFVLWNGHKRLIKRAALDKYLDSTFSV